MSREIMTVDQVAEYLQISKRSVYQLVKEGTLPAYKLLNKWRFDKEQIKKRLSNIQTGNNWANLKND